MAESKSGVDVEESNLFVRANEEFEAASRTKKIHYKETHGKSNYIDEDTPIDNVKGPSIFERAKEEIEALVETIHAKREPHHKESHGMNGNIDETTPINKVKSPDIFERAKEEIEALAETIHTKRKPHLKETHGMDKDIDENTPIDEVKGPSVFERAKEEIQALVETIHTKREPDHRSHAEKEGGCWPSLGRTLEHICSPSNGKKD